MTLPTLSPNGASVISVTLQQLIDTSDSRLTQQLTEMMATSAQKAANQAISAQVHPIADIAFRQFQLDSRQLSDNDVFILLNSHSSL